MDVLDLFRPEAGAVEMLIRGTVIYWFLFALLRLSGRRDIGSLGVADLLVLVLVADAAGDAMSGGSTSLLDGMVVVATIVGWSVVVDRLGYHSPRFRRWFEPRRVLLVKDGRIVAAGMRQEHLTRSELMEQLRLQGIAALGEIRRAYLEANGEFSIIRMDASTQGESTLKDE